MWVVVILDLLGTVVVPLSNALFRPRHPAQGVGAASASSAASWPAPVGGWSVTPGPAVAALGAPVSTRAASTARAEATTVTGSDGMRYERRPDGVRALAWPRYVDGAPLPAAPDGSPDPSGVARS